MTTNFGKRLQPLGLTVRELTGDTQLSKKEMADTQMIVTSSPARAERCGAGASASGLFARG